MKKLLGCLISLALTTSVWAQQAPKLQVFGGNAPRSVARVLYFDPATRSCCQGFSIHYGLPKWKANYEDPATFDKLTKGKTWRFGEGIWTTLDTNIRLKFGDRTVSPGIYYLGLARSADDKWTLEFFNPGKIHQKHLDAAGVGADKGEFNVPMTFAKADKVAETLSINLDYPKDNPTKVTLRVQWGNFQLTAPIEVTLN